MTNDLTQDQDQGQAQAQIPNREILYRLLHEIDRIVGEGAPVPRWEDLSPTQRGGIQELADWVLAEPSRRGNSVTIHQRWVETMAERGWQWGPERDPQQKTHPLMVRWDKLPAKRKLRLSLVSGILEGWYEWESNLA